MLSPLLFIAVLDLISRKTVVKDAMKKLLYKCRRLGPGVEWQTGATGDNGRVERFVYQTRAETEPREDGSAAHRPPEGRAGHRAGGKYAESTGQFRVARWRRVRRREDGERGASKSAGRSERMESS